MIRQLMRQDPAVRTLVGSVPLSLYFGFFFGSLVAKEDLPAGAALQAGESGWLAFVLVVLWIVAVLFTILADVTAHCTPLSLALPLEPRKLWLVRIASLLYAGLVPVVIVAAMASLYPRFFGGRDAVDLRMLGLGAQTAAALAVVILLAQTPCPRLDRIAARPGYVSFTVGVALVMLAVVLLVPPSTALISSLLLAASALGLLIYRRLPASFVVAPAHLRPERPGRSADSCSVATSARSVGLDGGTWRYHWLLHRCVWRVLMHHPLTYLGLGIAVFFGYRSVSAYYSGWDLIPYCLVIVIYVGTLLFFAGIRMYPLDPLPISRKLLFAHAVLTTIVALAMGLGVGRLHFSFDRDSHSMVRYSNSEVRVPQDCWEIAPDGRPPQIIAPWGESHEPAPHRVVRVSRTALYNPYERGEHSSMRFVRLQLTRAVEAIHGVRPPPQEALRSGDPESQHDGCCLTVSASVGRGSAMRSRMLATLLSVLGLISAASFSLGLQQFRASAPRHVFPWFLQGISIPVMLLLLLVWLGHLTGFANAGLLLTFIMVLVRKLGELLSPSSVGMWATAIVILTSGYLVMQWRFEKIEAPIGLDKKEFSWKL